MKKIVIVTGGALDPAFALSLLNREKPDHVIAVDGALAFFDKVEKKGVDTVKFDHLVGDFDTISPEILKKYKDDPKISVHQFVPEKDNTDTEISVRLALDLLGDAAGRIILIGAFGGRADHTLANLQLLEYIREAGSEGVIMDELNRVRLVSGKVQLEKDCQYGHYVSLVPVSSYLRGVTLRGFKYPLAGEDIKRGVSLLISNEIVEAHAEIEIGEGLAFLIESRDRNQ